MRVLTNARVLEHLHRRWAGYARAREATSGPAHQWNLGDKRPQRGRLLVRTARPIGDLGNGQLLCGM